MGGRGGGVSLPRQRLLGTPLGASSGVPKCTEVVFERGKMVNGEGLQVLNQTMKSIDPDENEIYKFLGVEQADGLRRKKCITE